MEQKKAVNSNLNLSRFEKFLLALIKFYPEAKKQKELAREAGIYESEISRWRKQEKKRVESYVEFFKKYIDIDPETLGFKLKVHEDLIDKLIEIAKKDEEAREMIINSTYFHEVLNITGISGLLKFLKEKIINLEQAKDKFLEIVSQEEAKRIMDRFKDEEVVSALIKLHLLRLLRLIDEGFQWDELNKINHTDEIIKNWAGIANWAVIDTIQRIQIHHKFMYPLPHVDFLFYGYCNESEAKKLMDFIAKDDDPWRTLFIDLFDCYLSTRIGRPWRIRKWINLGGCIYHCLEFELDEDMIIKGMKEGKINVEIRFPKPKFDRTILCPLDGEECNRERIVECEKFKKLLSNQKKGEWR